MAFVRDASHWLDKLRELFAPKKDGTTNKQS